MLLLVPLLVAVACLFAARAYISSVGGTYDYVIDAFPGERLTVEDVLVDPPGMAAVRSVEQRQDGSSVITFEALEDGEGAAVVTLPEGGMAFALRVQDGVVLADGVNFTGWEAIELSLVLVALVTGIVCLCAFARMYRDAWFGYEMASYAGAGLFFCLQAVTFLQVTLSGKTKSFADLANSIVTIADRFVYLMLAPLAVAAILVAASNLVLVRHEGRRLTNLLGVLFGLALAGACLAWRLVVGAANLQIDFESFIAWWFAGSLVAVGLAFCLALLVGVSLVAWLSARHVPSFPWDYVAILGCGLRADGTPTPLLAGRVEAARSFARRQAEAGYPAPTLVPSGGQGADEPCSEAGSMARYLAEQGDTCRVLLEDRSTNTRENMAFSRQVVEEDAARQGLLPGEARLAFATTNYHVLRGYVYAHATGLAAEGIAAPTKRYFWPNAFLREFVGLIVARLWPILGALACVEALYAVALYATILGGA